MKLKTTLIVFLMLVSAVAPHPTCGDGIIETGEDCEHDTHCIGDSVCVECLCVGENSNCGDNYCEDTEDSSTCCWDCGCEQEYYCSNNKCNLKPQGCGDGVCNSGEDQSNCCADCGCETTCTDIYYKCLITVFKTDGTIKQVYLEKGSHVLIDDPEGSVKIIEKSRDTRLSLNEAKISVLVSYSGGEEYEVLKSGDTATIAWGLPVRLEKVYDLKNTCEDESTEEIQECGDGVCGEGENYEKCPEDCCENDLIETHILKGETFNHAGLGITLESILSDSSVKVMISYGSGHRFTTIYKNQTTSDYVSSIRLINVDEEKATFHVCLNKPESICGNRVCEGDEDKSSCCKDCGCSSGFQCLENKCRPVCGDEMIKGDEECEKDSHCDSGEICKNCECIEKDEPTYEESEPVQIPSQQNGCVTDLDCEDYNGCTEDLCQSNICVNKRSSGCDLEGMCQVIGTRALVNEKASYCHYTGKWEIQKEDGSACQNNYQCSSNVCIDGQCYRLREQIKLLTRLANSLIEVLGRLIGI